MTFEKGSLILIDYTAKLKDGEGIFETTIEDEAKKHDIHEPDSKYQPQLVSIGEPNFPVLKGLDEALAGASAGDELAVEVEPGKGYGERDMEKIRTVPLRKLGKDAENASVGDTITVGGRPGLIRFIGSGRVQIDYNHEYAGKTLVYDVNVRESLESDEGKIHAILESRMPVKSSKISLEVSGGVVTIPIPDDLFMFVGLDGMKSMIQKDVFKYAPSAKKVTFTETHANPQVKTEPEPPAKASS